MNHILQQPTSDEGGDDFDAFGQYMALALKKLPINLALECQDKLQSLLTRYRLMAVASPSNPVSVNSHWFGATSSPSSTRTDISHVGSNCETSSSSASEEPQFVSTTPNDFAVLVCQMMHDEQ
jgi:hypothetical protein